MILSVENDTTCTFKDLSGHWVDPRSGAETLAFRLDQVDPNAVRPVYLQNAKAWTLKITSERPPFYASQVDITPSREGQKVTMAPDASAACQQGAGE